MAWGAQYTMTQLVDAASAAGFDDANAAIAGAVAMAESGGRMVPNHSIAETPPSRRGIDRCASYGPWQINYCPGRDRGTYRQQASTSTNLTEHARFAKRVHAEQGWGAWTMYTNDGWRRHIAAASAAVGTRTDTDASYGAAINQTIDEAEGPWAVLRVLGDPRRLGYLVLGAAIATVGVVLVVKEAGPAGLALDTVKGALT